MQPGGPVSVSSVCVRLDSAEFVIIGLVAATLESHLGGRFGEDGRRRDMYLNKFDYIVV